MKFYLYANTDQVYSALTNNSITSYANTIENLKHKTLSFMSDHFIFLSKTLLPTTYRHWKTDDIYFPVTVEVDFGGIDYVPCYIVSSVDGKATVAEDISNLKEAPEDAVGAFVCGEIPFAFISAILFENDENKLRFRKPSPDLWFPEHLYTLAETSNDESCISLDDILTLSGKVDEFLSEDVKTEVSSIVNKRNRYKGLLYFTIRETNDWQTDNFKSNVDAYIVDVLDGKLGEDGVLYKAISEKLLALKESGINVPLFAEACETDEVLLTDNYNTVLDKNILKAVINAYYCFDKDEISISRESINDIRRLVLSGGVSVEGNAEFDIIDEFLHSSDMNPQKALDKLDGHPVCKALMKFLDSSDNDNFMRYGCEDLNQYERRYAYMMFGALKGMRFVEREQKSNLALEHRLEELAVKKFPCDLLISFIPKYTGTHLTYGIDVCCKYWMSQGETVAILSMAANLDKVKAVYELIARDKAYKVEKLECFEKPCKIILCESLDDPYAYMCDVYTVDELKTHIKDTKIIKEYTKKHPMSIQYDSFLKKYIQNDKWYSAVFAKYCEDIQRICRR